MKDDRTLIYRRRESHPFRWLFAAIAFVLAMTITFEEVEGPSLDSELDNSTTEIMIDFEQEYLE